MNGVLLRAIEQKLPVELIYLDFNHKITQRKVLPHEIKGRYVRAYCHLRKSTRLFILDNILSVFPESYQFRIPG